MKRNLYIMKRKVKQKSCKETKGRLKPTTTVPMVLMERKEHHKSRGLSLGVKIQQRRERQRDRG